MLTELEPTRARGSTRSPPPVTRATPPALAGSVLRRQAAPALPGGGRVRLPARQAQGRRRPAGGHPAALYRSGGDRRRCRPDDRCESGVGRAAGHRVGDALAVFRPLWIEEPTSPDDILGHAAIRRAVAPRGRRVDRRDPRLTSTLGQGTEATLPVTSAEPPPDYTCPSPGYRPGSLLLALPGPRERRGGRAAHRGPGGSSRHLRAGGEGRPAWPGVRAHGHTYRVTAVALDDEGSPFRRLPLYQPAAARGSSSGNWCGSTPGIRPCMRNPCTGCGTTPRPTPTTTARGRWTRCREPRLPLTARRRGSDRLPALCALPGPGLPHRPRSGEGRRPSAFQRLPGRRLPGLRRHQCAPGQRRRPSVQLHLQRVHRPER